MGARATGTRARATAVRAGRGARVTRAAARPRQIRNLQPRVESGVQVLGGGDCSPRYALTFLVMPELEAQAGLRVTGLLHDDS